MDQLALLAKQVDSGLVSAAEACASLSAHSLCAYYYRREILFNLSLAELPGSFGLKEEELAQSWLSIARALIQAPKNEPPEFSPPDCGDLPGSNTPEEALKCALSKARTSKSADIVVGFLFRPHFCWFQRDCLDDLVEYYKSCGREADASTYLDELNTLAASFNGGSEPSTPASSRERRKDEYDSDRDVDIATQNDTLYEIIEVLSSDSGMFLLTLLLFF